MCIEDIAISRRCWKKVTVVPGATAVTLPANVDRLSVRLSFSAGSLETGVISDTPANAAALRGYKVAYLVPNTVGDAVGTVDLSIDYRTDGPAVMDSVSVYLSGGPGYVVETIMMPELAQLVRDRLNNMKAR